LQKPVTKLVLVAKQKKKVHLDVMQFNIYEMTQATTLDISSYLPTGTSTEGNPVRGTIEH